MLVAVFCSTLDDLWTGMEPVPLGHVPSGHGKPDRYVTVVRDEGPFFRVDLYASSEEVHAFEDAQIWSSFAVIG